MSRAAAAVGVAGLVLLAAACAGSPTKASDGGTGAIAFSQCMRSHGIPAYPNPGSGGLLPKQTPQQLGVPETVFQAAQGACIHLVRNGGRPNPAQVQQYQSVMLKYARCIRAHGVANMPDPDSRGHLDIGPGSGIDVTSPRFEAAYRVCKSDLSP
jgi:hypothetical protein